MVDFGNTWTSTDCASLICDLADPAFPIVSINPAFTELTGYPADEALGRNPRFLLGPESNPSVVAEIRASVQAGRPICRELVSYRKGGATFWAQWMLSPVRGSTGEVSGFICFMLPSDAYHPDDAEEDEGIDLRAILKGVPGFIFRRLMSREGEITYLYTSTSANKFLGRDESAKISANDFLSQIHPDDIQRVRSALRRSGETMSRYSEEYRLISRTGQISWLRSYALPQPLANGEVFWDGLAIDVTAEKNSAAELAFLSLHDSLTGLSNRTRFLAAIVEAVEAADDEDGVGAIFLVNLDSFQEVNEAHGLSVGDAVLQEIGRRILKFVDHDRGAAARIGGDEFAVLLRKLPNSKPAVDLAEALGDEIARPLHVGGRDLVVEGTIGAAILPRSKSSTVNTEVADELMKQADLALQAAKRETPGGHRLYEPALDDRFRHRIALRQSLQAGVAEHQFELHYQPIVVLASGAITGAEALVRWEHPTLGIQSPGHFIALAEETGLIVPLGEWIIGEAFRQGVALNRATLNPPKIAINVSSLQLHTTALQRRPDFIARVERALKETGADPRNFEFELTEGVLIDSSGDTLSTFRTLKAMGFSIAIDDFGTGHSTFRYLRDFPVDKIKIDRSFISPIGADKSDEAIVAAMIDLANSLGVKIVAEGVETRMQRDFLFARGCHLAQGYLFSMPLRAEDFEWMLAREMTLPDVA
jgi:diguanylate cyclase (GGDEF)-like protein/PAS domain S-box-containing protein